MWDWPPLDASPRPEHRWYDYDGVAHFGVETWIDDQSTHLGVMTACGVVMNPAVARVAYEEEGPRNEPCQYCGPQHVLAGFELVHTGPEDERPSPATLRCSGCGRFLADPVPRLSVADRRAIDVLRRPAVQEKPQPTATKAAELPGPPAPTASAPPRTPATSLGARTRTVARWATNAVMFAVVFAAAVPVAWIGLGIAVGFAYLGNPVLEGWWEGPFGFISHILGTILFAAAAGGAAVAAVSARRAA